MPGEHSVKTRTSHLMQRTDRIKKTLAFAGTAWLLLGTAALATDYRPGFPCPRPTNQDLLAVEICSNSEMARAELTYEKTYYAHRQQDGVQAYKALKVQAINYSNLLRSRCGLPPVGSDAQMPASAPACYVTQLGSETGEWNVSLHGDALQEGMRDIDLHVAAQQRLIDLGLLPPGSKADGIYGDATRIAIMNWQQKNEFPETGFLSDNQVGLLLPGAGQGVAPRTSPQTDSDATAVPPEEPTAPSPSPGLSRAAPQIQATMSGTTKEELSEERFLEMVAEFHLKYDAASNDFQKGVIFRQRSAALRPLLSQGMSVSNWTGKVYKLSSNGDGFGILEVTLSADTWLTTWNNSLSDMNDHTLIKPGSPVYETLGSLAEGDEVVFSGRLLAADDEDVLRTTDLMMDSKLNEPEFLFVFSKVEKR
jgi:peptidoglycan hydrolase-like protein with peptidoglycan-binding domain